MPNRTVFFFSDGTGITAEAFGNAILAQFEVSVGRVRLPFIDSVDKAHQAVRQINHVAEIERIATEDVLPAPSMGAFVEPFMTWLDQNRTRALVYFVQSRGASQQVEAIRRDNSSALIPIFARAAKKTREKLPAAEASIIAVALIAQIETFASAFLSHDASFSTLGRRAFIESGSKLADHIAGTTTV